MVPPADLEKWNIVGPVRTIWTETAPWNVERNGWGPPGQRQEADFNPAGLLAEERFFNPDGTVVHTGWTYDASGRLAEARTWSERMGAMSEERTTYSYDSHGNLTEQIAEVRGVNLSLDESDAIVTHETVPISNHHRFDYAYDDRGNWTEKVGWVKIGEDFTRFDIERREFTDSSK